MILKEFTTGTFSDLINIAKGYANELSRTKNAGNTGRALTRSSIMKASKDLIMSFPVLCSNTISPSTAAMIVKAHERNCVTTLQLLLTAANVSGENGIDVIKRWHNNIDDAYGMDDYYDMIDSISKYRGWSESATIPAHIIQQFIDENAQIPEYYPLNSFNENSVSNFEIMSRGSRDLVRLISEDSYTDFSSYLDPYDSGKYTSKEQIDIDRDYNSYKLEKEKLNFQQQQADLKRISDTIAARRQMKHAEDELKLKEKQIKYQQKENLKNYNYRKNKDEAEAQEKKSRFDYQQKEDERNRAYQAERDKIKDELDQTKLDIDIDKLGMEKDKMDQSRLSDEFNRFQKMLVDNDVKKCNELVPSMIILRYNYVDPQGKITSIDRQFIAGVKARLIACPSEEIIDHMRAADRTKVNLTNLIRATTKEISFSKDFVLGIDQAKIDAKQNSKLSKTNPIWRMLQARSNKSNLNRALRRNKANDAAAITTLVITQEEVNFMKKEYNLDLSNPAKARYMIDQFNLMGIIIVDEEIEVARFLYDGEKYFQDYSFNVLERETGDNSYKKVVNLISKINR